MIIKDTRSGRRKGILQQTRGESFHSNVEIGNVTVNRNPNIVIYIRENSM